jgi:hypothetical protein
MKISEVNDSLENMGLPAGKKKSILQLIDSKITDDMNEVISEIRRLEDKIQMVHDKLSNEIKTMYWVVGIAMSVILFFVARK